MTQTKHHIIGFLSLVLTVPLLAQHNHELHVSGELYITEGAQVFVQGDVNLSSANGKLANSGLLEIQGNLIKDGASQMQSNFQQTSVGKVLFKNDKVNLGDFQFIEGDFTGSNAFYNLVLDNRRMQDPMLYLKNGDIDIQNELEFQRGRIRTGDLNGALSQTVFILNGANDAITGNGIGNESDLFIEGRLSRSIINNQSYFFPVGSSSSPETLSQPLTIQLDQGFPNQITVFYEAGAGMTPEGTFTSCDIGAPPQNYTNPDGLTDDLTIDCVRGEWDISATNPNANFNLTLHPSQSLINECNGVKDFIGMDGLLVSPCPTNDFTADNIQSFGVFDIPSAISVFLLSVELEYFKAQAQADQGGSIELKWRTNSEQDNAGFELLRSTDGQAFKRLAWIEGQGTSNEAKDYAFTDLNVQPERLYYYQLRMVSFDQKSQYSDVVAAIIEWGELSQLDLFPNPVNMNNPRVFIPAFADGPMDISLFNMNGQLINSKTFELLEGFNSVNFLPGDLPPGVYQVLMRDEKQTRRSELVVIR